MDNLQDLDQLKKLLDDKSIVQYSANCVRRKSNFSKSTSKYRFDHIRFNPVELGRDIPTHSPKLGALLRKIYELDARDEAKYGHKFKHFIFSDLKSGAYGAKLIASALISKGMKLGYSAPRLRPQEEEEEEEEEDNEEEEEDKPPKRSNFGPIGLLDDTTLLNTAGNNFYLLASTSVYDKPISVRTKKAILAKFNERPANIHGELARIIVMDSGFKEGIDLFDVKYIHIFEPSVNAADQKQVIGRGTRTCGQKGLDFHPRYGWPLHVFVYDLEIPEEYRGAFLGAKSTFELYMKAINVDIRLLNFGYDIERVTVYGSVDYELNKNIHHFSIEQDDEIGEHGEGADEEVFGGGPFTSKSKKVRRGGAKRKTKKNQEILLSPETAQRIQKATENIQFIDLRKKPKGYQRRKGDLFIYDKVIKPSSREPGVNSHIESIPSVPSAPRPPSPPSPPLQSNDSNLPSSPIMKKRNTRKMKQKPELPSPIENILRRYPGIPPLPKIGKVIMGHHAMRQYIDTDFRQFTWDEVNMENQCIPKGGAKKPELIDYTPTQDFIRHYFTPSAPVKGMLLWHSVGTGKTCSAIAAASSSFEAQGYTILWVTRTTLKNDIWKNMFSQVCNENIRKKVIELGHINSEFPEEHNKQMRMLSRSWRIRPLSYKQFSNLVSKQNDYYKRLVKENGEEDPLRKTLLIIDEAHKLYGGGDLSSLERPDMGALHESLMRSYAISGQESVRLLLMTATPITESPIEIVQLLNLCKPLEEQMPGTFEEFSDVYLDARGEFTEAGRGNYLDQIAGHISYLNREKDARQFAQPIIHHVNVPILSDKFKKNVEDFDAVAMRESSLQPILEKKEELDRASKTLQGELKGINASKFSNLLDQCKAEEDKKVCNKIVRRNIRLLVSEAKDYLKTIKENVARINKEYKNLTLTKSKRIGRIKARIEQNPAAFEKYKESAYYTLRQVCSTKINTNEEFDKYINEDAEIERYNREIKNYELRIQEIENSLKIMVDAYRKRISFMQKLLSDSDLSDLERNVVRLTINDEKKIFGAVRREQTQKNREDIENLREEIKENEHEKKYRIAELRKTMKLKYKIEKKERKKIQTAREKMNQELRGKGKVVFSDTILQDLVDKYSDVIKKELEESKVVKLKKK